MISIALMSDVRLTHPCPGELIFDRDGRTFRLSGIGGAAAVLLALGERPMTFENLRECAASPDASALPAALKTMVRKGLVEVVCEDAGGVCMRATPTSELSTLTWRKPDAAEHYQLSRFAHVRRRADSLVVESVRTLFRVRVDRPAILHMLGRLARPSRPDDVAVEPSAPLTSVECWLEFLVTLGIVRPLAGESALDEDAHPDLVHREFHDVLLHVRSRQGLTNTPTGGVFPFAGVFPPSPAIRPAFDGPVLRLPQADLELLRQDDATLVDVMENRYSIREFAARHLSLEDLGTFLFRTARMTTFQPIDDTDQHSYEVARRPYPSGGGAYDLEIYLSLQNVDGVFPGFYHYDPAEHALSLVSDDRTLVDRIFQNALYSSLATAPPSVVFTITSRFSRLSWKYRGIAYATTLKNVGVLFGAMYSVAVAMRLAPCALGGGDSGLFGRSTGISHLMESPVGEFMLGVPARGNPSLSRHDSGDE
ncbi:SagB family peptide dehydrogenase [Nonomuraea fuscirosea]|jgi:oxazoline/thiazoline dehydrogenase|uniref:SagB family peptide dehydrogenase n=1 Tax=Nonomuraea fuscirosea TaxID=1291556 RepID=UPI003425EA7D